MKPQESKAADGAKESIRIAAVIPTYNNGRTIAGLIDGVRTYLPDIIVVDDGSTDDTSNQLKSISGIQTVTLPANGGKGNALRKGFTRARELGFTHAIALDADGQHLPADIPLFVEKIHEAPDTLWIGNRTILTASTNQPARSRFGAKFGAFWYKFYTGIAIHDTQCGFRAYPLKMVAGLGSTAERYEYELDLLIKVAWGGYPVREIPIHLYYHPEGETISHFRPVRDFLRLSVVNSKAAMTKIFLPWKVIAVPGKTTGEKIKHLFTRELTAHRSPKRAAAAIALGACMGLTPIHGFQVAALMALCVILRLNKPLAFLGVTISTAPLVPFWIAIEYAIGRMLVPAEAVASLGALAAAVGLGGPVEWLAGHATTSALATGFVQWVIGSVVFSIAFGIVLYFTIYLLFVLYSRMRSRKRDGISS